MLGFVRMALYPESGSVYFFRRYEAKTCGVRPNAGLTRRA